MNGTVTTWGVFKAYAVFLCYIPAPASKIFDMVAEKIITRSKTVRKIVHNI